MPTKQMPTKGTAHSTPTQAGSNQDTPMREAKSKGFQHASRLRTRLDKGQDRAGPHATPSTDTTKRLDILKTLMEDMAECTCPELRDMLEHEHGIHVSRMTVYRDVTEKLGLEFKLARAVPGKV
jgi:hypothetical protein